MLAHALTRSIGGKPVVHFGRFLSRRKLVNVLAISITLLLPCALTSISSAIHPLTPPSASGFVDFRSGTTIVAQAAASIQGGWAPPQLLSAKMMLGPLSSPPTSSLASLVYDVHDGYVLALSPNVTSHPSNWGCSAWRFSGGNWTNLSAPPAALSCAGIEVTYDSFDQYVLLFGGTDGSGSSGTQNYTWTYSNGSWTNLSSAISVAPPGTVLAGFAYDEADHCAVLFGGLAAGLGNTTSTWTYSAGVWIDRTGSAGAPPPNRGSMAYDAHDGYLLYFSGTEIAGQGSIWMPSVTWKFSGGTWTNVTSSVGSAPPGRSGGAMAYDVTNGYVVLFGGIYYVGSNWFLANDTWTFFGNMWKEVTAPNAPPIRENALLVPDVTDKGLLLFGGWGGDSSSGYADTWVFSGGNWSHAGPTLAAPAAPVVVGANLVLLVTGVIAENAAHFEFSGLPQGCTAVDAAVLSCHPSKNGTYHVTVAVQSSTIGHAVASARVVVGNGVGLPNLSPGGPHTPFDWRWWVSPAILALLSAALPFAVGAAWWQSRRIAKADLEARRHLQQLRDHGPALLSELQDSEGTAVDAGGFEGGNPTRGSGHH